MSGKTPWCSFSTALDFSKPWHLRLPSNPIAKVQLQTTRRTPGGLDYVDSYSGLFTPNGLDSTDARLGFTDAARRPTAVFPGYPQDFTDTY